MAGPIRGSSTARGGAASYASLPVGSIVQLVNEARPAPKHMHKFNVDAERNRPLDPAHVKAIKDYLLSEEEYILPPILLNSLEPLQIFTFQERGAFVPCWFVLPPNYKLHVTDGQHRIEGLRGAMAGAEYGKFQGDAVAVSIVEESSIEKTHQDFYDAAQVKPLPPAMLVEYD
jgi:DNA sulfur modification protein DndB